MRKCAWKSSHLLKFCREKEAQKSWGTHLNSTELFSQSAVQDFLFSLVCRKWRWRRQIQYVIRLNKFTYYLKTVIIYSFMLFGKRKLSNTSQHELTALQILRQWMPELSESDRREKEKGILLDDYSELILRSNTFVLWEISLPSHQIKYHLQVHFRIG